MDTKHPMHQVSLVLGCLLPKCACGYGLAQQLTLEIKDYATLPVTGSAEKFNDNVASLLARLQLFAR